MSTPSLPECLAFLPTDLKPTPPTTPSLIDQELPRHVHQLRSATGSQTTNVEDMLRTCSRATPISTHTTHASTWKLSILTRLGDALSLAIFLRQRASAPQTRKHLVQGSAHARTYARHLLRPACLRVTVFGRPFVI